MTRSQRALSVPGVHPGRQLVLTKPSDTSSLNAARDRNGRRARASMRLPALGTQPASQGTALAAFCRAGVTRGLAYSYSRAEARTRVSRLSRDRHTSANQSYGTSPTAPTDVPGTAGSVPEVIRLRALTRVCAMECPIRWTLLREYRRASRYLPVRSRCLHPGQQQGRRWPSSSSSWLRRMRRSRVVSCLASSTQQMNSLRAKGVMSFQASSAVVLAISASRRSAGNLCTTPPGTRCVLTGQR
jgi:hypothetical protein